MKNLISMTDFVLEQGNEPDSAEHRQRFVDKTINYANFLKQPLELWMFVPCDGGGNVLEEPIECEAVTPTIYEAEWHKWSKAKEICLFDGDFTTEKHGENNVVYLNNNSVYTSWNKSKTIEDLIQLDIQLTTTAQKIIV